MEAQSSRRGERRRIRRMLRFASKEAVEGRRLVDQAWKMTLFVLMTEADPPTNRSGILWIP